MSNQGEKKGVSAIDFFCIGFGAIVGVGWAVSINNWMSGSGGPIPAGLGYIAALIMMVPIALCYCELILFPYTTLFRSSEERRVGKECMRSFPSLIELP